MRNPDCHVEKALDQFEHAAALQFGLSFESVKSFRSTAGGYRDPSPDVALSDAFVFYMLGRLDVFFEQIRKYDK